MHFRKRKWKISIPGWMLVLIVPVFNEWMLHSWITEHLTVTTLLRVLGYGLALGAQLALPVSMIKNSRIQKWTAVGVSLILTVLFLTEYFINDTYQSFMSMETIFDGADGVISDYSDLILSIVTRNFWRIGLGLLPIVLFVLFARGGTASWKCSAILGLCGAVLAWIGYFNAGAYLAEGYNFDQAVKQCGLYASVATDLFSGGNSNAEPEFVVIQPTVPVTEGEEEADPSAVTEPAAVYEKNVMDFDFEALAAAENRFDIKKIHSYVASLTPSSQNAYTGLFAGKNLILITAESFAAEVIDPELTPTLYRLANEGIRFEEYYQPLWGGSTSTGEFSNFTSLVQASGSASMQESMQQDLFLNIGNQLMDLGYFSVAYHNHDYTYYQRHLTEPGMGYENFIALGKGMDITRQWPQSDLEMMEFTVEQYIDKQPFSIYYMTVSGHAMYNQNGNAMSKKNYDKVAHLDCSETLKCYLAAQLELEYALEYLVAQLEAAGIADDTVIVLGTDHYPYALEKSAAWDNKEDYLAEMRGYAHTNEMERDRSALIIWSGCIEDMDLVVETPVYSLDILPTLSNLFGVDYDSRLLVGRDVFSDQIPLVLWPNYCWKTEKGFYQFGTNTFIPEEGMEAGEEYINYINALVKNKISYSKSVQHYNYFNCLSELMEAEENTGN